MTATSYSMESQGNVLEFPKPAHAFGVDPKRRELYSLRQARYDALAQDVCEWEGAAAATGKILSLLDVGCSSGVVLRHLEGKSHFDRLVISGADLKEVTIYKRNLYKDLFVGDLTQGYPQIPANSYDVVICEQVLEHLPELPLAITTLERVLRPGGRLIIGVPIFLPPLAALRRHAVRP